MFLKLFYISLFIIVVSAKLDPLSKIENFRIMNKCIHFILKSVFQKDIYTATILNYGTKEFLTNLPSIKMNNFTRIKNWQRFFPQIYLIGEELADTELVLKMLIKQGLFTARSWYVYVSDFNEYSNFSFFTRQYIANLFAVNLDFDIYTIEPYRYENANDPDYRPFKIGCCKDIYRTEFPKYYMNKYPKKWRNTTVEEYFRVIPPFTTEAFDGLEDNLFDVLKKHLGFKNQRRHVPKENSTSVLLEHELEVKKKIKQKKIDIFGGMFVLRSDDSTMDYAITPSYILRTVVWMTPNAPTVSEWWRISHIFSLEFYLGCILILLILLILIKCIFETSIMLILSIAYQILLEYPVINNLRLKSFSTKIFASACILAMLTMSALFKNSLLVINATTVRENQLESLQDILTRSNLQLAGYVSKYLKEIFSSQTPGHVQINFNKMIPCPWSEVCLNRTAFQKDTAVLTERSRTLYYYIPLWYRDENGDSLVHLGSEIVLSEGVHMIFSKGYPLSRRCSEVILRADAGGWFQKQLDSLARAGDIKKFKIHHHSTGVTLKSISFIFYLWTGGIIFASIIFCGEVIILKVKERFNFKKVGLY